MTAKDASASANNQALKEAYGAVFKKLMRVVSLSSLDEGAAQPSRRHRRLKINIGDCEGTEVEASQSERHAEEERPPNKRASPDGGGVHCFLS